MAAADVFPGEDLLRMIAGLSEGERVALVTLMATLIAVPGLDPEVHRRATHLNWRLIDFDPLREIDRRYAIGDVRELFPCN